jgi:hypothetical protein
MIKRSVLIIIYSKLTLINIILEMIHTRKILNIISNIDIHYHEVLNFKYQLVVTKILLLLNTYYYVSFYLERQIDAIVHLKVVMIITSTIWLIMAFRLGFSIEVVWLFIIQALSLIIIGYSSDKEYGSIYTRYNHIVSTDLRIINMFIVSEAIRAVKSAIALFLIVLILADITNRRWNHYRILSYFKIIFFVTDRALQKQNLSVFVFNMTSVIIFGSLNILGIIYVYTLFKADIILTNEVPVFIETLSLIMNILVIYCLYLNNKSKTG